MTSRDAILKSLRQQKLAKRELPSLDGDWLRFEDPVAQFAEVLRSVGGECERVATLADVQARLAERETYSQATVRCSTVADVGEPTIDLADVTDPHDLETVDFAVLAGEFAVAENGAVWITDQALTAGQTSHRVLYFITQHLALVVPAQAVIDNMHQAYERLSTGTRQFGAFLSGPSKTADIEQSLVIGAHGPRSHVVYLVDSLDA